MYKMFCRNFQNYLQVNQYHEGDQCFRSRITRPIRVLADIQTYQELHKNKELLLREVDSIVHAISRRQDEFPSFKAFSWELYGYGFDSEKGDAVSEENLYEQLKLIDLLLSCHYMGITPGPSADVSAKAR